MRAAPTALPPATCTLPQPSSFDYGGVIRVKSLGYWLEKWNARPNVTADDMQATGARPPGPLPRTSHPVVLLPATLVCTLPPHAGASRPLPCARPASPHSAALSPAMFHKRQLEELCRHTHAIMQRMLAYKDWLVRGGLVVSNPVVACLSLVYV